MALDGCSGFHRLDAHLAQDHAHRAPALTLDIIAPLDALVDAILVDITGETA